MNVCMCVYMSVYVCICLCVEIHTHTHTQRNIISAVLSKILRFLDGLFKFYMRLRLSYV